MRHRMRLAAGVVAAALSLAAPLPGASAAEPSVGEMLLIRVASPLETWDLGAFLGTGFAWEVVGRLGQSGLAGAMESSISEEAVRYDAAALPPLVAGWRRDFVLYTDGWVKDGDLNTRHSATVEPWPDHDMAGYPGGPSHLVSAAAQAEFVRRYQTRDLNSRPFFDALRGAGKTCCGELP